jgi:Polyketide cyclase / dehydrase and lipid transport
MLVDVNTSIEISCPRAVVSGFASEPTNATRWYANIREAVWRTTPQLVVGSRFAFVAQFLGRRLEYTYEVTEAVAAERLVMRTSEGPFPMETTYEWAEIAGGTRMVLEGAGH